MALSEENRLVLEIGFAIEDPLGVDAVILARSLLRFARRVPEHNRRSMAALFDSLTSDDIAKEFARCHQPKEDN